MTKSELKIVFFGTPEFAVESLRQLVEGGYNVTAVVTMPDKQAGRGQHIIQSDVKKYALEKGLPVLQPEKLKSPDFVERLQAIDADLFIVIAFRMLPEVVWTMPRLGTFNLHASLLPKYRGAAPINWAVINGETETGVTTFFLKHEIDTGDIIQQKKIDILPSDSVGDVYDKLMLLGGKMVLETVDSIIDGSFHTTPQDSIAKGVTPSPAPKIFKETCHIDWNKDTVAIHNLIRGLSPYPAAWTAFEKDGKEYQLKIYESRIVQSPVSATIVGTVATTKKEIFVKCSDGCLEILSLQLSGKKRMTANEFLRGFNLDEVVLK